jgi:hypothetical protein
MESPTMVKEEAPSTPSPKTEDDDVSNAVLEARKKLGITIGRNVSICSCIQSPMIITQIDFRYYLPLSL